MTYKTEPPWKAESALAHTQLRTTPCRVEGGLWRRAGEALMQRALPCDAEARKLLSKQWAFSLLHILYTEHIFSDLYCELPDRPKALHLNYKQACEMRSSSNPDSFVPSLSSPQNPSFFCFTLVSVKTIPFYLWFMKCPKAGTMKHSVRIPLFSGKWNGKERKSHSPGPLSGKWEFLCSALIKWLFLPYCWGTWNHLPVTHYVAIHTKTVQREIVHSSIQQKLQNVRPFKQLD